MALGIAMTISDIHPSGIYITIKWTLYYLKLEYSRILLTGFQLAPSSITRVAVLWPEEATALITMYFICIS